MLIAISGGTPHRPKPGDGGSRQTATDRPRRARAVVVVAVIRSAFMAAEIPAKG